MRPPDVRRGHEVGTLIERADLHLEKKKKERKNVVSVLSHSHPSTKEVG